MEYVRDLISAVPTSANVKYYAKIVSEKAVLRRLIKANEEIANTCYLEKENTEIILEEAEKKRSIFSRDATMKNMFQSSR